MAFDVDFASTINIGCFLWRGSKPSSTSLLPCRCAASDAETLGKRLPSADEEVQRYLQRSPECKRFPGGSDLEATRGRLSKTDEAHGGRLCLHAFANDESCDWSGLRYPELMMLPEPQHKRRPWKASVADKVSSRSATTFPKQNSGDR